MDALILAGGQVPLALKAGASSPSAPDAESTERALLEVGGRPLVEWVLEALRGVPAIERVAVVAPPATLEHLQAASSMDTTASTTPLLPVEADRPGAADDRLFDNLARGVRALGAQEQASQSVLVCTCDVPLVTPASFEELLRETQRRDLELAYPVVERSVCEAAFPGGRRTYAALDGRQWTGGNALIVPRRIVSGVGNLAEAAYNARKNPLALAQMLGPAFLLRLAARRLTIAQVERKASAVLGCRAGAVVMQDAAIAFDVDKDADRRVAERALQQRAAHPTK